MRFKIKGSTDVQLAANRFQGDISTDNEYCPMISQRSNRMYPSRLKIKLAQKTMILWNIQVYVNNIKVCITFTKYNKDLRKSHRDSWRSKRLNIQACDRLYKILSKAPQVSTNHNKIITENYT